MESLEASKMTPSEDVETFRGRIVYNADGSALILDDPADLEGADERGSSPPLVSLAHHVSCHEKVVHSYRVFSLHHDHPPPSPSNLPVSASVPIKPILMCFICKLSFSYSKSFIAHASGEHRLDLSDREMELFSHSCTSAIIQGLGKEKTPLLSFLEPIINHPSLRHYLPPSSKAMDNMNSDSSSPELYSNKMIFNHKPTNCDDPLAPELEDLANIEKIAKAAAAAANSIDENMAPNAMGSIKMCSQDEKINIQNLSLDIGESTPKLSSPSSHSPIPSTSSMLMGCSQHPDGKINGVECPKCDMILGSARTLGGHMNLLHSRNSCKTLKCPKCNWHYKYQETLEIHMKEKHPENEMNCIYCISNQPHPRLSRGETYNCGYKPYRCEVCNYSTTTKGNLSIHMQSDKHINNVQEIQNGSLQPEHVLQTQNIPTNNVIPVEKKPPIANKPKAMWRCDVCNYETNVARNLRIHMTSEKHTHNMMVLEQNVKHMQQMSAFQAMADPLFQFHPGLLMPCDSQLQPEAALADMAYNHALLMMATQHQHQRVVNSGKLTPMLDIGAPDPTLRPEAYGESTNLFLCCICGVFSSDSIDALHRHVQEDRTRIREDEVLVAMTGSFLCKLCSYKTNLKANFQLHCKTDKHLQRLQHVNHIKEGGPANEWKIKFSGVGNSVQVRCTCCNYYTNSIHKLQMHTASPQHDACSNIYLHLLALDATLSAEVKYYHCKFCTSNHRTKLHLILHVHSFQHLCNSEGREEPEPFLIKELKPNEKIVFEAEGEVHPDIPIQEENEAPKLKEEVKDEPSQEEHRADYLNNNNNNNNTKNIDAKNNSIPCPLCQESIKDYDKLKPHLMDVHQVNKEGVQRLLAIVEKPSWTPKPSPPEIVEPKQEFFDDSKQSNINNSNNNNGDDEIDKPMEDLEEYSCPKCFKKFSFIEELFNHQNEHEHIDVSHTPKGLSYHCWNKMCNQIFTSIPALQMHFREVHVKRPLLSVSDRHVYKYRCNQCSLAFKTLEKLNLHSQYHAIRAATKCVLCGRSFRTMAAVQKHVEAVHVDMTKEEMEQYRNSLANNPLLANSGSGVLAPDTLELLKKETIREDNEEEIQALPINLERMDTYDCTENESKDQQVHNQHSQDFMNQDINKDQFFEDYLNSQTNAEEGYSDPNRKYKCHRCKVAYTRQCYLTSHNKTLQHRKGEKMTYPLEKYLDPNRPFKCEICKESFTQKNILLVHYNSVSHLHKVKMVQKESGNLNNNSTSNAQNTVTQGSSQNNSCNMTFSSPAMNSESDKKPYKCNICKVSYSQASTLDIHVRSVLHQTRASKIHELALSGQYDPGTPLIERPENTNDSEMFDNNKDFQFMNNIYKSLNSEEAHQAMNLSSQPPILFPLSKTINSCQRCGVICGSQEALIQHQYYCPAQQMALKPDANSFNGQDLSTTSSKIASLAMNQSSDDPMSTNKLEQSLNSPQNLAEAQNISPMYMTRSKFVLPKTRFPIYKNLLEGFGFDVVMQFNEHHKKKPKVQEEEKHAPEKDDNNKSEKDSPMNKSPSEENKTKSGDDNIKNDLPEINKSICNICGKDFSSIWVLKAHQEEIHKKIIPFNIIDKIASEFKIHFESKLASQATYTNQEENIAPETCSTPSETGTTNSPPQQSNVPPTSNSANFFPQNSDLTPNQVAANQMAAAQMQFNQFLMSMGLGMGLPMGMNLPFAAAAALHPSLIPVMIPSHMDPLVTSSFGHPLLTGSLEANFFATQQKIFQQQQQQQINQQQQKRARTRINDEQLKILRAYFDINNSPTEEQLIEMSEKSGLPLKVIKHWFRNTLFKERQRNKDSPYNFNNPPSTYLNLEEYEKTGEAKVTPINNNPEENNKEEAKSSPPKNEPNLEPLTTSTATEPQINSIKKEPTASNEKSLNEETNLNCSSPYNPTPPKMKLSTPSPISTSLSSGDESLRNKFIETPTHHFFPTALPMPHIGSSITPTPPTSESPNSTGTPCSSGTTTPTTTMSSGKRANRTRFTDYQIKVLQEFFETNAYPKDDDLEYLSKLLCLSPRVIVVWFQNARQKARKVYENQPPPNEEDLRSQKSPGLTYQCRKCMQVFQRYYELIKHQKNSCYKDDIMANHLKPVPAEESNSALLAKLASESDKMNQPPVYRCDKCSLVFTRLDLWREHQIVHIMNPTLFTNINNNAPYIYPYETQQPKSPINMLKRKLSDDEDENKDSSDQPRDKRLRTTILPEQLDYLYQKYQIESNPSRKMLDAIAKEVGLKKRVVQVWFQNTRARERKGQFRAHQQVIHKRCPFCRALFKARSALESHLATRHADQYTKGEIIIDALPDGDCDSNSEAPSTSDERLSSYNMPSYSPSISQASMLPTDTESLNATMKRYYQDSLKKYIDEITAQNSSSSKDLRSLPTDLSLKVSKSPGKNDMKKEDTPLDLSKPLKMVDLEKFSLSDVISLGDKEDSIADDAPSETYSESTDNMDGDDIFYETSPSPKTPGGSKRYRTQMSNQQLKVMKSIFNDYKTPSMAECEQLGREIGLPKRVIQVWFQNARAKEKKAKLVFAKTFGQEYIENTKLPEECKLCHVKYKFSATSVQDHIFSKEHIDMVRSQPDEELSRQRLKLESNGDKEEALLYGGGGYFPGPYLPTVGGLYDAGLYGTPLSLLQLPVGALPEVGLQLAGPGATCARYSQDGKTLADLAGLVAPADLAQASEVEQDVGFACKKCQLVFPAEVLCQAHQRSACFAKNPEHAGTLRLTQVQIECRVCRDRFATLLDFKFHCDMDRHVKRVHKYQRESVASAKLPPPLSASAVLAGMSSSRNGLAFAAFPPDLRTSVCPPGPRQ